jgi:hypothetical protein
MPKIEKCHSALLLALAALPLVLGIGWSVASAGASQTPLQHCTRSVSELNDRLLAAGFDARSSALRQRKRAAYNACLEDPAAFDRLWGQDWPSD